jgi:hypothetical protein
MAPRPNREHQSFEFKLGIWPDENWAEPKGARLIRKSTLQIPKRLCGPRLHSDLGTILRTDSTSTFRNGEGREQQPFLGPRYLNHTSYGP